VAYERVTPTSRKRIIFAIRKLNLRAEGCYSRNAIHKLQLVQHCNWTGRHHLRVLQSSSSSSSSSSNTTFSV
jgi:hypothetical protein